MEKFKKEFTEEDAIRDFEILSSKLHVVDSSEEMSTFKKIQIICECNEICDKYKDTIFWTEFKTLKQTFEVILCDLEEVLGLKNSTFN